MDICCAHTCYKHARVQSHSKPAGDNCSCSYPRNVAVFVHEYSSHQRGGKNDTLSKEAKIAILEALWICCRSIVSQAVHFTAEARLKEAPAPKDSTAEQERNADLQQLLCHIGTELCKPLASSCPHHMQHAFNQKRNIVLNAFFCIMSCVPASSKRCSTSACIILLWLCTCIGA